MSKTILLADANPVDRHVLEHRLKVLDYTVISVEDGLAAENEIKTKPFDLLLLDIRLKNKHVKELLKLLRSNKNYSSVPVLIIANSSDLNNTFELIDEGADDYILKPYKIELVRSRLQIWLENEVKSSQLERFKHKRILIVDDNEMNRDMLSRRLLKAGFSIETAINGLEALSKIEQSSYHLVLLDIMMPEMNGFEVLQELRKEESKHKYLPVIMLTALNDPENIVKSLQYGADDYLVKPFNFNQIKQRIKACFVKYA